MLAKKQKQHERAKEALAAAVLAEEEAQSAVKEAHSTVAKATQDYAKVKPGGGPPAGLAEAKDDEYDAITEEELQVLLADQTTQAEKAAQALSEVRSQVEKRAEAARALDVDMADAEAREQRKREAAEEAEHKRKEEQQQRDEEAKKRRLSDEAASAAAEAKAEAARLEAERKARGGK